MKKNLALWAVFQRERNFTLVESSSEYDSAGKADSMYGNALESSGEERYREYSALRAQMWQACVIPCYFITYSHLCWETAVMAGDCM